MTNCVDYEIQRRILAIPYDLEVELKIIQFFKQFLSFILSKKKTTVEQDMKELNLMMKEQIPFGGNDFFACIYRLQQKQILLKNIELVRILEHIVLKLKETKDIKQAYMEKFEFETEQEEFIKNRIILKEYLRYL